MNSILVQGIRARSLFGRLDFGVLRQGLQDLVQKSNSRTLGSEMRVFGAALILNLRHLEKAGILQDEFNALGAGFSLVDSRAEQFICCGSAIHRNNLHAWANTRFECW